MDDKDYGINWVGLAIKVVIFVVISLLAIWLISKIFRRNKPMTFDEYNNTFKEASIEYYKNNLLNNKKVDDVSLKELINFKYLKDLSDKEKKMCDLNKSKSSIENVDNYYNIKTNLICGKDNKISNIKLGNNECKKCDVVVKNLKINNKQEEKPKEEIKEEVDKPKNEVAPATGVDDELSSKTILYEYIKEENKYSKWYIGNVKGTNIENDIVKEEYSKYCKNSKCIEDLTSNSINHKGYKIVDSWIKEIPVYRYKFEVSEYKYSNLESIDGYKKTGNYRIAD